MHKRILIVEDDDDSRSLLVRMIQDFGYDTIEANSGNEAIEKTLSEKPDLIIMDLDLPGMSGLDAARVIKEDPSTAQIPMIAYTAFPPQTCEKEAFSIGMVEYLQKPVSWKLIKITLEKYLAAAVLDSK